MNDDGSEAQFEGGWLHTEVGRQVGPVVRPGWRGRLRRLVGGMWTRLRGSP